MGLDPDAKAAAGPSNRYRSRWKRPKTVRCCVPRGEILKWVRKENSHAGSRRPMGLIETDAGAVEVFDYIDDIR
ncbi:MbcA/ParS/Xre antitoxin family protein [Neorhizobium sp. R1-B]|uniref:MbcA/ParS/Xre antitoxin family protein n=1 Tax=Neorhizobium sp. R1-B TaxID=2485162 RepID=UPI001065AE96|nr:MbcA/ParS/Xre antitoxin family protein [Neorhizobium sp. R1-B]